MPLLDIKGRKFGRLRVVRHVGFDKWGAALWLCSCKCGNETIVRGYILVHHHQASCGCARRQGVAMIGKRFGYLRVVRFAGKNKWGQRTWKCVCKCGAKPTVGGAQLRSGVAVSCGCYRRARLGKSKLLNLKGQRFGRLVAVRRCSAKHKTTARWWVCRCDCGNTTRHCVSNLRNGTVKSCGCGKHGQTSFNWKHGGMTLHRRELHSYVAMKQRCLNEKNNGYELYGGRGITVCDRWLGANGFVNFLADMGPRPPDTSLDRINVMGNYEPKNCRWADRETQAANRRCMMTPEELAELERAAAMEKTLSEEDAFGDGYGYRVF